MAAFPVIYGICLDAEAIWLGKAPENAQRPVLLSHGAYEIREGLAPLLSTRPVVWPQRPRLFQFACP